MIALRYGTPPIVHGTGGLRDTVVDEFTRPGEGTGFVFEHPTADGLAWACRVAADVRATEVEHWDALVDRGMAVDFDWRTGSAPRYLEAYRRAIAIRRRAIAGGGRSRPRTGAGRSAPRRGRSSATR
jgi:starch synthase